jgi:cell wall-associated NlpC family hydrolase
MLTAFAAAAFAAPGEADPLSSVLIEKVRLAVPAAVALSGKAEGQVLLDVRDRAARVREQAADMVLTALQFVGMRYRRGGDSEAAGFDCSGFTRFVLGNSLGLVLPRRVDEQASAPGLVAVKREDLQPGDLVFFNTLRRTFSHVGIYIGDNRFVHAPRSGAEIRTENMGYAYWTSRFTGARRAETIAPPVAAAPKPIATLR